MMLHVSNLAKSFGDTLLFEQANLVINAGERVGLVGPNGCGKTTLLRILCGELEPDTGSARFTIPRSQIGYLPQSLEYDQGITVRQALEQARGPSEEELAMQVQTLAEQILQARGTALVELERRYTETLDRLAHVAEQALPEHEIERVLVGLGLADVDETSPVEILSGGQKTRLSLARLLLAHPKFLILDEPTNHLDITGLEWLEGYLQEYAGAILIVSHDRAFLDRTVTAIVEIDALDHTVRAYAGNYSDYAQAKETERRKHWQRYKEQEERIAQLQSAVRQLEGQARGIEHETIDFYWRKRALKVARQAVVHRRRIERMLNSEEHLEKPETAWSMKLEFIDTPPSGQDVLVLKDMGKCFDTRRLFGHVNLTLRRGERIILLGPNGAGKTTLLRIIAGLEPPSEGTVQLGSNVRLGYFAQEQELLDWESTPYELVRKTAPLNETEARTFLHYFLFAGDDVFVPVRSLSYGQRARLALGILVAQGCNLLLLDEPINHLDIPSRESFERALESYEGTILAVVHDRYFAKRFATGIWAIEEGNISRYVDLEDLSRVRAQRAQEGRNRQ